MGFKQKQLSIMLELVSEITNLKKENFELSNKYDIIIKEQKELNKKIELLSSSTNTITDITQKVIDDAKKLNSVQNSIENISNDENLESVDIEMFGGSL